MIRDRITQFLYTLVTQIRCSKGNILLGRVTGAGAAQEITVGSGLSLTGTTLSATGGGGSGATLSLAGAPVDGLGGTAGSLSQLAIGYTTSFPWALIVGISDSSGRNIRLFKNSSVNHYFSDGYLTSVTFDVGLSRWLVEYDEVLYRSPVSTAAVHPTTLTFNEYVDGSAAVVHPVITRHPEHVWACVQVTPPKWSLLSDYPLDQATMESLIDDPANFRSVLEITNPVAPLVRSAAQGAPINGVSPETLANNTIRISTTSNFSFGGGSTAWGNEDFVFSGYDAGTGARRWVKSGTKYIYWDSGYWYIHSEGFFGLILLRSAGAYNVNPATLTYAHAPGSEASGGGITISSISGTWPGVTGTATSGLGQCCIVGDAGGPHDTYLSVQMSPPRWEATGGVPGPAGADGVGKTWVPITSAAYDALTSLERNDTTKIYDITDFTW